MGPVPALGAFRRRERMASSRTIIIRLSDALETRRAGWLTALERGLPQDGKLMSDYAYAVGYLAAVAEIKADLEDIIRKWEKENGC